MNTIESLNRFGPELFLLAGAFLVLLADLFTKRKKVLGGLSLLVLLGTVLLAKTPGPGADLFFGFYRLDSLTHFFRLAACGMTALTILASLAYRALPEREEGEYYSLFLFMTFGLILMAASTNLLMIFLSIEFVSLLSYILTGFLRRDPKSKEAAIKYLLYGSIASAVMLFGMSLAFGASGVLELAGIARALAHPSYRPLAVTALMLILVGLGFKISMAPFHMWAPDVYEAAPTPVAGFLTVAPKALGFSVLIRVLSEGFPMLAEGWGQAFFWLSILTMTIGNGVAIAQTNIKRLLAYSSIAQAGYILMGIVVFNKTGLAAVLIYLVAYAFTNLGAFTAVIAASNHLGDDEIESYRGLSKRSPFLAASLTLFLLSLAGIPPLAGFIGKFYVFSTAIEAGRIALAVAAALNSAVAAFYYFKVVRAMYLAPADPGSPISPSLPLFICLLILLGGTVAIGIAPSPLIRAAFSTLAF